MEFAGRCHRLWITLIPSTRKWIRDHFLSGRLESLELPTTFWKEFNSAWLKAFKIPVSYGNLTVAIRNKQAVLNRIVRSTRKIFVHQRTSLDKLYHHAVCKESLVYCCIPRKHSLFGFWTNASWKSVKSTTFKRWNFYFIGVRHVTVPLHLRK